MTKQMTIVVIGSLRVKMVANLIFEWAAMLSIFTDSPVFISLLNSFDL